ncbi:MAG: hypothetical protein ACRDCT_10260 [Shewanella sp.]
MYAIQTTEQWQVIGFNKDNTQHKICKAHSLAALLGEFTKYWQRAKAIPVHREVLDSFKAIKVWNVNQGFTGLELPSIN